MPPASRIYTEYASAARPFAAAPVGFLEACLAESGRGAAGLLLEAAFHSLPIGIATLDLHHRYTLVNPVFAALCGIQAEDLRGLTVERAMQRHACRVTEAIERCLHQHGVVECEISLAEPAVFLHTCRPLSDVSGRVIGICSTLVDITERKRAEAALRESEENHRCAVELNPHVPWTFDPIGEVFQSSSRLLAVVDLRPGPVSKARWAEAIHPEDVERVTASWAATLETGTVYDEEYRMRAPSGSYRWMRARASSRRDEAGAIQRWYGVLEDVDERRRIDQALREKTRRLELASRQLALLAREDHLTGLANRRHFDLTLEHEVARARQGGRPMALIMVDVDRFKRYNDLYGHVAGDACLRRIAATLVAVTRVPQDLVARYGGEEFALVLPDTSQSQAMQIAHRAIEQVRALCIEHSGNLPGRVTLSAGVASLEDSAGQGASSPSACELIELADAALYQAKEAGRDRAIAGSTLTSRPSALGAVGSPAGEP